jgi:ABC-type antimicrobial peptide transport system permease subunit
MWLILREAAVMLALGLAIALPTVWQIGHLIESQLFGVRAKDAYTIVGAVVLIALVTVAASAFPVWRVTSVNPVEALRYE